MSTAICIVRYTKRKCILPHAYAHILGKSFYKNFVLTVTLQVPSKGYHIYFITMKYTQRQQYKLFCDFHNNIQGLCFSSLQIIWLIPIKYCFTFLEKINFGHDSSSLLFYCKCAALQTNAKCTVHAADIAPISTKKNGLNKS